MTISREDSAVMLGYAFPVQGPRELECEMVMHGIFCGDAPGYNYPELDKLKQTADDGILLLQIGSDTEKKNCGEI